MNLSVCLFSMGSKVGLEPDRPADWTRCSSLVVLRRSDGIAVKQKVDRRHEYSSESSRQTDHRTLTIRRVEQIHCKLFFRSNFVSSTFRGIFETLN